MKKGFTLVELSIVLVIIGLLIGGILIAQSMVSTVKLQKVIRQLAQYDIAVTNFYTKYNQMPGDSSLFPNPGNHDLYIANAPGFQEPHNFWPHLSLGVGLKTSSGGAYQVLGNGRGEVGTGPVNDNTCPMFDIDQEKTDRPCLIGWSISGMGDIDGNIYEYGNFTTDAGGGTPPSPRYNPLTALDAKTIDLKIDDGLPLTGNVVGLDLVSPGNFCSWGGGAAYRVFSGNSAYECSLYIAMQLGQNH